MNNTTGYGDVSVENGHTHSIDISAYTTNDSLDLIFYFVKKETGTTEHMDLSIEVKHCYSCPNSDNKNCNILGIKRATSESRMCFCC